MYIYKITVTPIEKSYIGLDTKPSYKLSRFKSHLAAANKGYNSKLHDAIRIYGVENCKVEILEDNINTIGQLALLEIEYIDKFNTYKNGLNSSLGGDGLGKHDLKMLSEEEIIAVKKALGDRLSQYNKSVKWAGTTKDDRKQLTKHLHTEEIYQKKSASLKLYYKHNPEMKAEKYKGISAWRENNREKLTEICIAASEAAAIKNRKKIKVEHPDGQILTYNSITEFRSVTGQNALYIIRKTEKGESHNGYKAWRLS